jgi:hypothetical protein
MQIPNDILKKTTGENSLRKGWLLLPKFAVPYNINVIVQNHIGFNRFLLLFIKGR